MRCHLTLDPIIIRPHTSQCFSIPLPWSWLQPLCEMSVLSNWSSGRRFVPVLSFGSSSLPVGSPWSYAILPFVRQGAISRSSVSIHIWRWGRKWWMMETLIWHLISEALTPCSNRADSHTLTLVANTAAQCSWSWNAHYLQVTHFSVMWGSAVFVSRPVVHRWMEDTCLWEGVSCWNESCLKRKICPLATGERFQSYLP